MQETTTLAQLPQTHKSASASKQTDFLLLRAPELGIQKSNKIRSTSKFSVVLSDPQQKATQYVKYLKHNLLDGITNQRSSKQKLIKPQKLCGGGASDFKSSVSDSVKVAMSSPCLGLPIQTT